MNYTDYQKQRIKNNQKFLLKLLHLHIGNYYPLRKWLGIDYKGKIDEVTHLSIAYDTKYFKKGKKWFKQQTRTYQQPDLGYKLNLLLDKIPQLAIPALLQPAYGLGALAFFFLTQTTYQPSSKDSFITDNNGAGHDDNYGSQTYLNIHFHAYYDHRIILEFDISDIPDNATFSQGSLYLYYYEWISQNVSGQYVWANKLTRTDWVEAQATWNIYKTGSNWTSAGGDYVTSNPARTSTGMPGSYGWVNWNVKDIVIDAYDNNNNVEILLNRQTTISAQAHFYSKEYTTDTSLRPKLTVTYTTPTAFTATLTETLTPTDALSKSQGSSQSLSETLTLSDTLTKEDAYDFITTCNWTQTGTYTLSAYRGSFTNIAGSVSLFYRKKGAETWIETTNGQINIDSTGEWEVANNWNKSGNDVLTHSYYGITAINSCTEVYFNETTLGSSVGDYFLGFCWYSCSSLTSMPSGFNLPSGITSVGDYFLNGCWYSCSSLTSMPSGFNLPSGITSVGSSFLSFCWDGCSSLTSMPSGFNLPSGITTVGDCFLYYCWYNCTSLTQTGYTEDLVFEFDSTNTFAGTCPITPDSISGASKENPISVAVHRSLATFEVFLSEVLTSLDTLAKQSFFSKALSESLTLSEVLSKTTNFIKSFSESIGLTDAIDNVYGKLLSLIETINLADTTISKTWNATITFLETTTLSDIVDKLSTWAKSLAETLSLSDTITKGINTVITITETLSLSDILTKTASWVKSLTETTIMSDIIKFGGNWWNRLTKHTSIWTEGTKHSSSIWTHKNKSN